MGKYVHYYNATSDYTYARTNNYSEPWVSYTSGNNSVNYNKTDDERRAEIRTTPLTLEIKTAGSLRWRRSGSTATVRSLQYSKNGGTWTAFGTGTTLSVAANDTIQLRGSAATYATEDGVTSYHFISGNCQYSVRGNIMSLVSGWSSYSTADVIPASGYFGSLFHAATGLTDATNLVLPATNLKGNCYRQMFAGCTNLTGAPSSLPAEEIADYCYEGMFSGCTKLATTPTLPATSLGEYCYANMFRGSTGITATPSLPATEMKPYCYQSMFQGCTHLTGTPVSLQALTLKMGCYQYMFKGCTALVNAPEIDATSLDILSSFNQCEEMFAGCTALANGPSILKPAVLSENCYKAMFSGCTNLTESPVLPASEITCWSYYEMFRGCSALNRIECYATNIPDDYACEPCINWVNGVASSGTFIKATSMSALPSGANGIPTNWTVQNA